ncbi:MAG: hypothetical protein ACKVU4_15580 [Phycisphaerales bacterium]
MKTTISRRTGALCLSFGVAALVLAAGPANAQNLIYFEENGGGGNPRGLYTLDPGTGLATLRATVGGAERFFGMAVQPGTNTVFAVSVPGSTGLWTMDVDTGATTFIGDTGIDTMADIHFDPTSGTLYGIQRNVPYGIYKIDHTNAASTFISNTDASVRCGMVIDASGNAFGFSIDGILSKLDIPSGATALIGGTSVGATVEDGEITPSGAMYFTLFGGTVYKVDPNTGANALIHTSGMGSGLLGLISEVDTCYPDCNGSGSLTVADFGCFQGKYVLGDLYADCNASGTLTVADFGCFQGKYVLGCP